MDCIPRPSCCVDAGNFRINFDDRYDMPNDPICRHLTPERTITLTALNALVNTRDELLASDRSWISKMLGVTLLAVSSAVVGTAFGLVELAVRIVLVAATRMLAFTAICDYFEGRECCTNPLIRMPMTLGGTALVSLTTLGVGIYTSVRMLTASDNLEMSELISSGSLSLATKTINWLYNPR